MYTKTYGILTAIFFTMVFLNNCEATIANVPNIKNPLGNSYSINTKEIASFAVVPSVELSISQSAASENNAPAVTITVTANAPVSGNQTVSLSISGAGITSSDYYLTNTSIIIPSGQTQGSTKLIIADDAVEEATEEMTITISTFSAGISPGNNISRTISIENNNCSFVKHLSTVTSAFGAEISAFDADSKQVYTVAGDVIERFSMNNQGVLSLVGSISPGFTSPSGFAAIPNSVAIKNGVLAASFAIRNNTTGAQDSGIVAFYQAMDASFIRSIKVGYLPDMVTFSPNGNYVLTANEGEPNSYGQANSFDPEGSISIIDISIGIQSATLFTAGFTAFNGQISALKAAGVRIFGPNATVAQDFEPEYIAFSNDGQSAMITMQENNALAKLDMATKTITQILPLGLKDHNVAGNGLDASDRDSTSSLGKINIKNWPVKGMYMPDAISSYTHNNQDYYFTANEGDARDYTGYAEEVRVGSGSYVLDPTVFPTAATLKNNANLGRLQLTKATGDTDNDGDYDEIHALGARSFSVWNSAGALVYDSGDQLEKITARQSPTLFNSEGSVSQFDTRSDNKGPEPEGIAIGIVNQKPYIFVGLERTGDVMVFDITNPLLPEFVQYINMPLDLAVEGLLFIPSSNSPTGKALLITTAEVSRTVTVFELGSYEKPYYSDGDGDGFGIEEIAFYGCGIYEGYAVQTGDCNDNNVNINPSSSEICDELDNNCNQLIDEVCGCTDEEAHNFTPAATIDDGSCMTCTDNIKNGTETGIDCGGSLCVPCNPPVAVCGNIITVYANAGNLVYNGPSTADVYLIPAVDLDGGSTYSGQNLRTVARTLTNVSFNWTNQGACIDATPNNIYNNIDKGLVHRNCLPVTPADFNKIRNFEMKITDANGTSTCTGRYLVVNGNPPSSTSPNTEILEEALARSIDTENSIEIYPNPGTNLVNLYISNSLISEKNVVIIRNTLGAVVKQIENINTPLTTIEFDNFPSGIYYFNIQTDGEPVVKKWVKI